ncbi:helix-turn-helix domain-containing protein [Jeotgalibaca ciconiae]|uniref:Helix-turn-helix domain-containing protein n=1 Tax=Jeotgalibaca ciconiae TaxID=2496265 RepID=A0A3Q9BJQ9_9LACT|nr:helix-turn-helix domain-containing protein [Jeotgalibaca ciconiae]AZP03974.1 helix-turn-helix domain-containing protein [Jeotgalibaca ciconiae]
MTIGERIKEARKEKGMTQQELAQQLNISRSAISNWEIGRNYPDIQMIVSISNLLDVSLDQLLKGDEAVVKKIADDTHVRKKQSFKIKILYTVVALLLVITLSFGVPRFINTVLSRESQIKSVELLEGNKIKIETNLPPYRTISGYMLSSAQDPWELDLAISIHLDFSMINEETVIVEINDDMRKHVENIVGINLVNSRNKIFKTIPLHE